MVDTYHVYSMGFVDSAYTNIGMCTLSSFLYMCLRRWKEEGLSKELPKIIFTSHTPMFTWTILILLAPTMYVPVDSMEHYSWDPVIQEHVDIAYEVSGWDEDFIYTLQGENDRRSLDRQSDCVLTDDWSICGQNYLWMWVREQSYWICQISKYRYPHIVNDARFRTDARRQIEKCFELYSSSPYLFSSYETRFSNLKSFTKKQEKIFIHNFVKND